MALLKIFVILGLILYNDLNKTMTSPLKKRRNGQLKGIFREIFVSATRELAPFGMVFVFPPENFEQQKLGTLFGIIKISDNSRDSSYVSNLLASVIKKEYFSKPDRSAEESFEASLRKANLALSELARRGSVNWSGKINFAGGSLDKNNLHFSKLGTTAIFLLRGGAIADIGKGAGTEPEQVDPHPLKTFSDISSGKLEKGDCLIFATSDLAEIFSPEELRQNVARFSREEFPEIISASLASNSELAGTVIINMVPEEEIVTEVKKEPAPKEYLAEIPPASEPELSREKAPVHIDIAPVEKKNHLYVSEAEKIIPQKTFKEKLLPPLRTAWFWLKANVIGYFTKIPSLFRKIDWPQKISYLKISFGKINLKKINSKIWIGAGTLLLIIAVFFLLRHKNISAPQPEAPQPNIAPAATLNDIQVKNIDNINEIATLPQDSRSLVFLNNTLYALSGEKSISEIDPGNGQVETTSASLSSGKFSLAAAMPDLSTIFVLTADKKIISFTPINKNFQENGVSLPGDLNAADIKTYLTYIYLLDPSANKIYRYPRAEGGFGGQQDWLKTGADINNSVSFGINEDLFIATKTQVIPYLQGKKDEKINFENPNISLAIDKIYTEPNFENIYILDNKNHRIVLYSKDGKILAQYFNKTLSGIEDFTVDEKNKVIYLQKAGSVSNFSFE